MASISVSFNRSSYEPYALGIPNIFAPFWAEDSSRDAMATILTPGWDSMGRTTAAALIMAVERMPTRKASDSLEPFRLACRRPS